MRLTSLTSVARTGTAAVERPAGPTAADRAAPRTAARHASRAEHSLRQLAWQFVVRGRPHYLALLLSDFGRDIVTRKYDAFTTDRAYGCKPAGALGPLGRVLDRLVAGLAVHETLRQRLDVVVGRLERELTQLPGDQPARLLSAPCGLARDVTLLATRLRQVDPRRPTPLIVAADLDATGDVLDEARRRATQAGIYLVSIQDDLFQPVHLPTVVREHGPFDVVSCIGLVSWLSESELDELFRTLRGLVRPGGLLLIDNFRRHGQSYLGEDLDIYLEYHPDEVLFTALRRNGFELDGVDWTRNGIAYVASGRAV